MQLSPKVTAAIDQFFPEADRPAVARLLATYGDARHETETERVHLLILKASSLDLKRVRLLVELAKQDYRDLIMAATQPLRVYIVGVLRDGAGIKPGYRDWLKWNSIQQWTKAGVLVAGGEFQHETESRGLFIFRVDSIEAAQALVNEDPGVQEGRLRFEFHSWLTRDGLQIGTPLHFLPIDIH
jgi:uncharacterized protein YciI